MDKEKVRGGYDSTREGAKRGEFDLLKTNH
jgi:hypothetical protein